LVNSKLLPYFWSLERMKFPDLAGLPTNSTTKKLSSNFWIREQYLGYKPIPVGPERHNFGIHGADESCLEPSHRGRNHFFIHPRPLYRICYQGPRYFYQNWPIGPPKPESDPLSNTTKRYFFFSGMITIIIYWRSNWLGIKNKIQCVFLSAHCKYYQNHFHLEWTVVTPLIGIFPFFPSGPLFPLNPISPNSPVYLPIWPISLIQTYRCGAKT